MEEPASSAIAQTDCREMNTSVSQEGIFFLAYKVAKTMPANDARELHRRPRNQHASFLSSSRFSQDAVRPRLPWASSLFSLPWLAITSWDSRQPKVYTEYEWSWQIRSLLKGFSLLSTAERVPWQGLTRGSASILRVTRIRSTVFVERTFFKLFTHFIFIDIVLSVAPTRTTATFLTLLTISYLKIFLRDRNQLCVRKTHDLTHFIHSYVKCRIIPCTANTHIRHDSHFPLVISHPRRNRITNSSNLSELRKNNAESINNGLAFWNNKLMLIIINFLLLNVKVLSINVVIFSNKYNLASTSIFTFTSSKPRQYNTDFKKSH